MAMLDYKVFQYCGVLVSLIKTYFISIFSKKDRQFWRFPNCVLDHVIPKFSSDASDPPPLLSFSFPTLLSSVSYSVLIYRYFRRITTFRKCTRHNCNILFCIHCIKMQSDFGCECVLTVPQKASKMHNSGAYFKKFPRGDSRPPPPQITD